MTTSHDLNASTVAESTGLEIAIIGMAGRFPGAADVDAFWRNLCEGVESVRTYTDEELLARGVPAELVADPDYVKTAVAFEGAELFDAAFFGYSPREAERLDPQHRVFLECAWEAMENAGYDTEQWPGTVAVFAGAGANVYLLRHLLPRLDLGAGSGVADLLDLVSGNGGETLCTRVAYKLNLRGPAVTVQTACSTSLTAVHLACQSLLAAESDMALAGGVSLNLLQSSGYRFQPGAIFSPDGHCRAFDAEAAGTLLGSGAGVVVLKRLDDALRDGDHIRAVIRATAANNDAADKIGFTAPSVNGQAAAIHAAHVLAGVPPDSISYVEAHGTGTMLGDPIEVAALTQAFRLGTARSGFCALGSVKTNVGHLDCAAGVAGLIKTALALEHRTLPASLHFERPNPKIDFAGSPFLVNAKTRPWDSPQGPRRAGVSGFGIGGTNVHAVLEEAPAAREAPEADDRDAWQVLPLSASSAAALQQAVERLSSHLQAHPEQRLADVAHTLQVGRRAQRYRAAVAANEHAGAVLALGQPGLVRNRATPQAAPDVVFLFPGAGSQHARMGAALYDAYPVFRDEIDRCLEFARSELDLDLRPHLWPEGNEAQANARLAQVENSQPAIFVLSYAMAKLWQSLGVVPSLMLGHSLGEYVAATVAGVFSIEDALSVVVARARLQGRMGAGAMTSVLLSAAELAPFLGPGCDLAAVNGERLSVLTGPLECVERAEHALSEQGHVARRLHTSVAFHSSMADPILDAFENVVASVPRRAPAIPFLSNVTGRPITAEQAMDPAYWARHLRGTVRFADGLDAVLAEPGRVVLEVGPSDVLTSMARQHAKAASAALIVSSQAHARQLDRNGQQWVRTVGELWTAGVLVDWAALAQERERYRVPLPTYPFQRRRFWIEPGGGDHSAAASHRGGRGVAESLYVPSWKRSMPWATPPFRASSVGAVLVLGEAGGMAQRMCELLAASGCRTALAERGTGFTKIAAGRYRVPVADPEAFERLLRDVQAEHGPIGTVLHLWSLGAQSEQLADEAELERSFFSVLALVRALGAVYEAGAGRNLRLCVVTNHLEEVVGGEALRPIKATLRGLTSVIGQEYPHIRAQVIDAESPEAGAPRDVAPFAWLFGELAEQDDPAVVAYRRGQRWVKTYEPLAVEGARQPRLRTQGAYLITGGLGGVSLALARHLAKYWQARLVLVGRSALPAREHWERLTGDEQQPRALRQRLEQLLELENLGASVLVVQADVTDTEQLRDVVRQARERFGAIHGVVHAAGAPGSGMLSSRTPAAVREVFKPKIDGTRALLAALAGESPEFVLLCSSISAIAGGLGMGDYAAANAYLDAMAVAARRDSRFPVFAVDWDAWRDLGMAAGLDIPAGVGWEAAEGARAFEAIVCGADLPHIIVCTTDLAARLRPSDGDILAAIEGIPSESAGQTQPRPTIAADYDAPTTDLERRLASIWSDRLGIAPIGRHDNLYELGGNSLLAIQILARVRAELNHNVQPSAFFRHLTVAGLAGLIGEKDALLNTKGSASLVAVARDEVLRPAPIQRRVWVFDRLSAGSPQARAAYNETVVFSLDGQLDRDALRGAIDHIIARHEVLRTAYPEDDEGEPTAVIAERIELPMSDIDLSHLPADSALTEFASVREGVAGQAFDLSRGPLMRIALVRLAERRHLLIVSVHHIVFDGWSTAVFTREFCEIYRALCEGKAPALAPLPIQYADYAAWHDQVLQRDQDGSKAFWKHYLEGAPLVSVFAADRSRPKTPGFEGDILRLALGQPLSSLAAQRAREWDVSVFTLLLSAYLLTLHRHTGAAEVVVGTDVAGRDHPALEALIGFFVNVVPIRSRLDDAGIAARRWVRRVHESVAQVFDHQSLPLDRILSAARIARGQGANPLLQMLFVMQNVPKQRFDVDGLAISVMPADTVLSKFDQAVFVHETDAGLAVDWVFSTALYDRTSVSRVAEAWQAALRAICADPDRPIDSVPVSSASAGASMTTSTASRPNPAPKSKLDMLASAVRQPAARAAQGQVRLSFPSAGRQFPVMIEALERDLDPVWWASQQRDFIEDKLRTHAGIVFRNFGLTTPQDFERFSEAMEPSLYGSYGDLPKKEGGVNTYRSTPYPENQMILYHNECSHTDRWPRKQWFFCELPSRVGGITPIVDCRELLTRLPAEIVDEMARKGLLYVRTFHPKLDVSWQHFFKTEDRAEVEARLAGGGIEWRWLDGDVLQTRTRGPAVITHPLTGAKAFFNQVQLHHVSCLEPDVREDLLGMVGLERMPRHVYFGDGSPIPDPMMTVIGQAYEACAVRFDWQRGDVVMLDNMLAAHARDPYEEPRKIVVAMGAMYERDPQGRMRPVSA
ncbi:MAG: SDR family NAD(P)-dependent oxidoreductase [Burkholderiaceae bacterium]